MCLAKAARRARQLADLLRGPEVGAAAREVDRYQHVVAGVREQLDRAPDRGDREPVDPRAARTTAVKLPDIPAPRPAERGDGRRRHARLVRGRARGSEPVGELIADCQQPAAARHERHDAGDRARRLAADEHERRISWMRGHPGGMPLGQHEGVLCRDRELVPAPRERASGARAAVTTSTCSPAAGGLRVIWSAGRAPHRRPGQACA